MKSNLNNIYKAVAWIVLMTGFTGCADLLNENLIMDRTTDNYYLDDQGFTDLVNSCYSTLREVHQERDLVLLGTDIFTQIGDPQLGGLFGLNEYSPQDLNSEALSVTDHWRTLYFAIGRTNTAIERSPNIEMNSERKSILTAEAMFLRSMFYFYLVQQYGDVPLMLNEVASVIITAERTPQTEVYRQIVSDLEEVVNILPLNQSDYGRATKGAAQHLLAKILLTRAYTEFTETNDFAKAGELAEAVITSGAYRLLDNYAEVFQQGNEKNDEIIFSVQYSSNTVLNGLGSNAHSQFGSGVDGLEGMERNSVYNRIGSSAVPSRFLHTLFDIDIDTRYDVIFLRVFYATINQGSKQVGDTVLYFPPWSQPWSQKRINEANHIVVNWDEYYMNPSKFNQFPPIWKFFEANLPYGDALGTRDQFVFRLAETHLLAAEAFLNLNNPAKALQHINAVRRRAATTGSQEQMELASLTIDDILDERARELCGEDHRWTDLKRTGKLVERVLLYNDRAIAANQLREFHLLRPIPLSQIERTTNNFPQNPGY